MRTGSDQWDHEYSQKRGIPSSFRRTPSSAAVYFYNYLLEHRIPQGPLLDLGCGNGRNSLFFAERNFTVSAVDYSESAIRLLAEKAKSSDFSNVISITQHDLSTPWSFTKPDSFDSAIDIFVSKHIIDKAKRNTYLSELLHALKIDSYFLVHLAGINDGYYGTCPIIEDSEYADTDDIRHIIDPFSSSIESLLFTENSVISFFTKHQSNGKKLELYAHERQNDRSSMYGKEYDRELYRFIFRCVPA